MVRNGMMTPRRESCMIRADLTLADARLGSDFPQFTRTKRKRPANRGPLQLVKAEAERGTRAIRGLRTEFRPVLPHSAPEIARQSLPAKFRFPDHEMERPKQRLSAF